MELLYIALIQAGLLVGSYAVVNLIVTITNYYHARKQEVDR